MRSDLAGNNEVKVNFWRELMQKASQERSSAIGSRWCKQPTGVFVRALKVAASGDREVVVVASEYPRPTLEQLNKIGEMGELVYTGLNEPGYPEVVVVNTGSGVLTKVGSVGGRVGVLVD